MLKKIHHLAIICSDYPKSKKFYTEILGLEVLKEIYRKERDSYKLNLKVGKEYQIELFSFPNPPKRLSYQEACGLRHLAFEVKNFEKTIKLLRERGIPTEPVKTDETTKKKFTFFNDPDGLPIEIYEE